MGEKIFKGTPGKWAVAYLDNNGQSVVKAEYIEIATCWHHCVQSIEKEMHANACLIAAAPELLTATKALVSQRDRVLRAINDHHNGKLTLAQFEHEVTGALTGSAEMGGADAARAAISKALDPTGSAGGAK